ncbi:MAG TPA: phage replisome organizer N-terminal domain-containing protein [Clostridium sp.]
MRERKYIKFRVDMYDGTKFKIIDRRPERDLIHYAWTRFVALAGKVNLEGNLYMSRNIKYTVETLAIEFNREVEQIQLALDVLIELEMMECTDDKVYRVKNFNKHQNIKVKEKIKLNDEDEVKDKRVLIKEDLKNEIDSNQDKEAENKVSQSILEEVKNDEIYDLEIIYKDSDKVDSNRIKKKDDNMSIEKNDNVPKEKDNDSSTDIIPMLLDVKNNKQANKNQSKSKSKNKNKNENKKKNSNIDMTDEETKDDEISCFYDGDVVIPLKKGESVTTVWSL